MVDDNDVSQFGTDKAFVDKRKANLEDRTRKIIKDIEDLEDEPSDGMSHGIMRRKLKKEFSTNLCQWTVPESGVYFPIGETAPKLPAGYYKVAFFARNISFFRQTLNTDNLLRFEDSKVDKILKEIDTFWDSRDKFETYGFLQKRGIILYGPQGSGKSASVQLIVKDIIERDGVVIMGDTPELLAEGLRKLRIVEPDRKLACVFEDIDAIIQREGEHPLLSILDGDIQVDRLLNLATTNYPERLDKRIVARPRRFDHLVFVDMPKESIRKEYFLNKLNLNKVEVSKWVKATDGLSFASMAELVVSVKCLGNDFEGTIKRLRQIEEAKATSDNYFMDKIGFAGER